MSKTPIPKRLRDQVAQDARHRCGYCRCSETITGTELEVDHLTAEANRGRTVRANLWLACTPCNKRKAKRRRVKDPVTGRLVRLFDPRRDKWDDHFRWAQGGLLIEGISDIGRAMVEALKLNHPAHRIEARRAWINAGWHPPVD